MKRGSKRHICVTCGKIYYWDKGMELDNTHCYACANPQPQPGKGR